MSARAFSLPLPCVLVLVILYLHPEENVCCRPEILRYANITKDPTHAVSLFCRPRRGSGPSPTSSTSATAGWSEDGLQTLVQGQGPRAAAVAGSLHSGLATALDFVDILRIAHNTSSVGICPPATVSETGGDPGGGQHGGGAIGVAAEKGRKLDSACPACPVLVLKGFYDGVFNVIRDCEVGCRPGEVRKARTTEKSSRARASTVVVGNTADVHGALLRSALKLFADFVVGREVALCVRSQDTAGSTEVASDRVPQARRLKRDEMPVRPEDSVCERRQAFINPSGHYDAVEISPVRDRRNTASSADPVRQLVALKFFLQAMCLWPRLAAKLMREIGVWNVLFSEHGMRGGSYAIARAIDNLHKPTRDAGTAAATITTTQNSNGCNGMDNDSSVEDFAIGWGLVHDATLILLEAVTVTGLFLRVATAATGAIPGQTQPWQQQKKMHGGIELDEPVEMQEYVRFLKRAVSGRRPSTITAIQGCRWLTHMVSTESSPVHCRTFLPLSLRGAILQLAFRLCRIGDGVELEGMPGTLAWPLVHASLSLATDIVSADTADAERGLLFEAAACLATPTDVTSELGKPCTHHRPTSSLTSDVSTPDLNAAGPWSDLGGSGGSRTPVSNSSLSPRMSTGFPFGRVSTSPPHLPSSLPEMLSQAALDPRVRRTVFLLMTKLGVQAGRVVLMSHDTAGAGGDAFYSERHRGTKRAGECSAGEAWAVRGTAAEVLGGLVEGYLCLCERAVAETAAAGTFDEVLLLDALRGACALVSAQEPDGASVSDGAAAGGVGGGSSGRAKMGDAGLLPLLQEAFREHQASFRLLMVLEKVVAVPAASTPVTATPPTATGDHFDVVRTSLAFFTGMMAGNSLGKDAFRRALASHSYRKLISTAAGKHDADDAPVCAANKGGAARSFSALADLISILPAAVMSKALMEMLMDGEVPSCILDATKAAGYGDDGGKAGDGGGPRATSRKGGAVMDTPPEIRNPLVVPLIFRLLPDWPASEQISAMRAFRFLLKGAGGGVVNRSTCCDVQPALMDQVCAAVF